MFLYAGSRKRISSGIGGSSLEISFNNQKYSVYTDVRIYVSAGWLVRTHSDIQQVGPIVIYREHEHLDMLKKQTMGGVWETTFGNLEPENIYYLQKHKKPILVMQKPEKYKNHIIANGRLTSDQAGQLFLKDILEISNEGSSMKEILGKAVQQQ